MESIVRRTDIKSFRVAIHFQLSCILTAIKNFYEVEGVLDAHDAPGVDLLWTCVTGSKEDILPSCIKTYHCKPCTYIRTKHFRTVSRKDRINTFSLHAQISNPGSHSLLSSIDRLK